MWGHKRIPTCSGKFYSRSSLRTGVELPGVWSVTKQSWLCGRRWSHLLRHAGKDRQHQVSDCIKEEGRYLPSHCCREALHLCPIIGWKEIWHKDKFGSAELRGISIQGYQIMGMVSQEQPLHQRYKLLRRSILMAMLRLIHSRKATTMDTKNIRLPWKFWGCRQVSCGLTKKITYVMTTADYLYDFICLQGKFPKGRGVCKVWQKQKLQWTW